MKNLKKILFILLLRCLFCWFWQSTNSLFVLGLFSGFIFLVTLIPQRAGGFVTDGARLLRLARRDAAAGNHQEAGGNV